MNLYEKYRPDCFENVIGQNKAVKALRQVKGYGGRAFWLSGMSGTGKTTLARIVAHYSRRLLSKNTTPPMTLRPKK